MKSMRHNDFSQADIISAELKGYSNDCRSYIANLTFGSMVRIVTISGDSVVGYPYAFTVSEHDSYSIDVVFDTDYGQLRIPAEHISSVEVC